MKNKYIKKYDNRIPLLIDILKLIQRPALFLIILFIIGSASFMMIEKWSLVDSLYMTVITISTVGFGEVHPLSDGGKIFTIFLVIGGVIFYGIAISELLPVFIEKKFQQIMDNVNFTQKLKNLKNHYIICGGGRMAYAMIKELESAGKTCVVIETNQASPVFVASNLREFKALVLARDALLEESLLEAGIDRAAGLASVLTTDADNLFVVLSARSLNKKITIETRISRESSRSKMMQAGANKVVSPYSVGGLQIARSFLNPKVYDFMEVVLGKANFEFELKVHIVVSDDSYVGMKLSETNFRKEGYIVIGVKQLKGKMKFGPDANFILKEGYEILLMGSGMPQKLI